MLNADSTILCQEREHTLFMIAGMIGLFLYYPLNSFLFPNLQFEDILVAFKYDPTWCVISSQLKLLMTGK